MRSRRGWRPVQVEAIPIADATPTTSTTWPQQLQARGIRVEVDDSDDRMQKKIRNAQLQKVPFMVIAGATTSRRVR